jgi:hypothetical protein
LLERFLLLVLLAAVVQVVAARTTHFMNHWLLPALTLTPLALLHRAGAPTRAQARRLGRVLLACGAAGLLIRLGMAGFGGPQGGWNAGRDRLFAQAAEVVPPRGVLLAEDAIVAGNLKRLAPDLHAACPDYPMLPPSGVGAPLVLVWNAPDRQPVPRGLARWVGPGATVHYIEIPAPLADHRYPCLGYAVVPAIPEASR